jgi:predicted MFS family arabinose efflux permease
MSVLTDKKLIWQLGAAGFISAADNWFVSPILPAIANDLGISTLQAGIILTAYLIPYGVMQPVYGFISDSVGKARLLRIVVWGLVFGTTGCFMAGSLGILCFWRFVTGFFAAGIIAVSLALIGDTVAISERQRYVGMFIGTVFLGQGVGAGLGGIAAKYVGWPALFAALAVAALCTVFLLRKLPQGIAHHTSKSFGAEIKQALFSDVGQVIFPLAFCAGFLLLSLYGLLGIFLHDVVSLDYLQIGAEIMLFGMACFVAGRQVGHIVQNIGQRRAVTIGSFLACFTVVLLTVYPCWVAGCIAITCLGVSYILIQSTLATLAFEVSSQCKGLPSALIGLGLFGGGGLGTACISGLLSISSYKLVWLILGVGFWLFKLAADHLLFSNGHLYQKGRTVN